MIQWRNWYWHTLTTRFRWYQFYKHSQTGNIITFVDSLGHHHGDDTGASVTTRVSRAGSLEPQLYLISLSIPTCYKSVTSSLYPCFCLLKNIIYIWHHRVQFLRMIFPTRHNSLEMYLSSCLSVFPSFYHEELAWYESESLTSHLS